MYLINILHNTLVNIIHRFLTKITTLSSFIIPHCCCAFLSTGWFTKVGKIPLLPSSALFHEAATPVKHSLLTPGPAFYPVPAVHPLSWNAFNVRKIHCSWQSLPSLVITALQVLCGSIQISHCQSLCQGAAPLSGSTFGMTVLPLIQCLCGDSSCPRWQWAAASGIDTVNGVNGVTANPPGAYCGFCIADYSQGITNRRSLWIRCAVYLLVKGWTAQGVGSFLVKGSICLVQSEIPSRENKKATDYKGMTWMEQEQGWSMLPLMEHWISSEMNRSTPLITTTTFMEG